MEVESSTYTDFISCDRAGRRNAVHDIERDATTISMRKLSEDLGDLAVEGAAQTQQQNHPAHQLTTTSINPAFRAQANQTV
ncbi:cAMP-dependent protein kinase inhibitor gamma isoform X1 [Calypte anna]|uniref:cAMP-dependent protein kinase inhibitor gamma isoform X1 n=1 Tax=Calypte anna TaxID=9244 RepID=UPI0011C441D8|nr:cAMP-dependent protein kinase inhibitor gamma isoform X1 [Calypte anna]